ncbi:MAG: hypothetical protein QNJ72_06830 [Pleurocapsa sp. MO_226.B13]|nr:hypothetical protein [Pleurocapsa sp. MO_226.B13]
MAWSRILFDLEVLIAINTHALEGRGADVAVDSSLSPVGEKMTFLYKSDWTDNELRHPQTNQTVPIVNNRGRATLRLDLPPAGMAILTKL